MKTFKELKKRQEELNNELLKCPECGVICAWGELIELCGCGACWFNYIPPIREQLNNPREWEINYYSKNPTDTFCSNLSNPDELVVKKI